ncbi:acetolactate synthase large subunit [Leptolyngbya sp. 7M]|uniref:acetolactate synthase large subunit n=1 Tax=Leptolyngbya sp. 7M TaxID=2812896 RepID=UPI001CED17FA|nr:acetolactate synthase large subunit [Leptolyngbya sp. 7M]
MNTAELLVRCLENEGVEYVFGLPGEENLHVLQALKHSSIKFITTRHEQGAAFMADVYGRLTGKAGVCLSTLGPGATNLMTGVADANLDRAPLVAITGQVGTDRMHIESHQYLDLVAMFAPVTKWSTQIVRPSNTPEIVRRAFKLAQIEKPGAVHIDLPENIAAMSVVGNPLRIDQREKVYASFQSISRAAEAISQAANPIILVGNGAIRAQASDALTKFARTLDIPVANTFMGKGVIPYTDRLALWSVGLQQRDHISCGFDHTDLVIAVGYDLIEYSPKRWNPDGTTPIIHIDQTPAEVDSSYIPLAEVVGDIADSLEEILKRADRTGKSDPYAIHHLYFNVQKLFITLFKSCRKRGKSCSKACSQPCRKLRTWRSVHVLEHRISQNVEQFEQPAVDRFSDFCSIYHRLLVYICGKRDLAGLNLRKTPLPKSFRHYRQRLRLQRLKRSSEKRSYPFQTSSFKPVCRITG